MPKSPEVVTGMRPPRQTLADQAATKSAQAPAARPAPPEGTVYHSSFLRYRVQLSAPPDVKDPVTGRTKVFPTIAAQFEDGEYVNNHRDPQIRAFIDQSMAENPRFGIGKDFWLKSDADKRDQVAAAEGMRQAARTLPIEMKRALVQEMLASGELDLDLPPRKAPNEVQPEV